MTNKAEFDSEETLPLKEFTEKAYLEYSMYVILDRALPHIGDGLKPVQRRIVYAMSELGLKATSKYKKSARTVGDVLGKFHPHGDTACYEAMVLMAQPFSYRYPLVDGQGNWGSPDDPKSFAAMRYTESRLSKYSEMLLKEVDQGTVDWVQNFDGTLDEPATLPARLPNLLLNGTTGIAVGMSTDVPPHNLTEVAEAAIALLEKPKLTTTELFQYIKGPDYPTEAEVITPTQSLIKTYESGTGSVKMRAVYEEESGEIVITALPHQVSGAKILEQIAGQMQAKKLPMVSDLRDESDHNDPTRLVIVPKSNRVDKDSLMAHLFATTDLERSYRINLNVIGLDGKPKVKGLAELLGEWLTFRKDTVRNRLQHRLEKVLARLHILDGLMIAYLNIDQVIEIIRNEDHPKPVLMEQFGLSDRQAESILDLKLRHLAKLEEQSIKGEQDDLTQERKTLESTLASDKKLHTLIKKEIRADMKKFGDERRSPVVERLEAQALSKTDILPVEPVTVILSNMGWVRAAKGHDVDPEKLKFKSGDSLLAMAKGRNNQQAVFLDTTGRSYAIPAHSLPSSRSQGEPLTGRLNLPPGADIQSMIMGPPETHVLLSNDAGYGFIAKLSDIQSKNKAGKVTLNLPENAQILKPLLLDSIQSLRVVALTNEGRLLVFPAEDLPVLARGKGNKIIDIPARRAKTRLEILKEITLVPEGGHLVIHAGLRHVTLSGGNLEPYCGTRGRRGKKLPRGFQNVSEIQVIPPEPPEEKNQE